MNALGTLWGATRYEFRMQIRRLSLWLAYACFSLLTIRAALGMVRDPYLEYVHYSLFQKIAALTLSSNWLAPIGLGIFLADRLPRDGRTKVEELLNTLPGSLRMRLLGKYLGSLLATLIPSLLLYLLTLSLAVWQFQNWTVIPMGLLCYPVIVFPGMLLVAAFSLACPRWVWVPLYQFLFFGYWFWGNMLSPNIGLPTLSGTILTPIGSFITQGFFHASLWGWTQQATLADGIASLVAMVGIAVLVNVALYYALRWEQSRQ